MTLRARGGPDERQSGAEGALGGLLILAASPQESAGPRCLHLGYLLGEAYWGKGTASALLRGFTEALERSGTPVRLLGGVARDNPASARVLEKSGFVADPAVSGPGSNMYRRDIG